uniref:Fatty acid desaturase domain-containing protein n=1 Tax=Octactis speculum TaxID=3111310 RepID=A0A7S2B0V8_9STRA|mmetsp:Transcript_18082/g.24420  ORF Transcript_18082/g.24420 Transcript_18082/m.24420 type:complete len:349 (+) Transcript_18082:65-1111(+)|eukprot:CAMPEP_0185769780 /NCGR_PEP_ID=MMETSP1174-20130828/55877_1 /TAXON_ID=35687 /ORGANISM="Dictyocha speculum, Strain CCMP1381" /LENGTH=348 /DNA_ID=CAMNT_0028454973 /DNA_START=61 /DNA_END=1107 /DNA_ORIENTATION=+
MVMSQENHPSASRKLSFGLADTVECIQTCVRHYKEGNINWPMVIYITFVHVTAFMGLVRIPEASWKTLLWAFILWPISGLGITGGAHRLWAHRSYTAHWSVRCFLMLANSIANQGTIFHWARDHRVHHKHTETTADPHNATRGFFYAHVGWLLVKKDKAVVEAGRKLDFSDLKADGFVMFQKRLDPWFTLFMSYLFPGYVARYCWGAEFWSCVWIAGALRYCAVLHFTWLVNSAAHIYGDHPYNPSCWTAENPFVSLCSLGEGWHNWHHKYPFDYAASEFGIDRQFNPTKLFLDGCAKLGLVYDRKRAVGAWTRLKLKRNEEIEKEEAADKLTTLDQRRAVYNKAKAS